MSINTDMSIKSTAVLKLPYRSSTKSRYFDWAKIWRLADCRAKLRHSNELPQTVRQKCGKAQDVAGPREQLSAQFIGSATIS